MNLYESFRIAINSLMINRLRAALTTLGIIIGVGAVISLVSLGRGVEGFITSEVEGLGANILTVRSAAPSSPTRTRIAPLTTVEAADLSLPLVTPSVKQIALLYSLSAQLVSEQGNSTRIAVSGVTANYVDVQQWPVRLGQFFTAADVEETTRVVVLGLDVVEDLFDVREFDPLGQTVRINDRTFTVIGVMEERGGAFGSQDNVAFVPISTAQTRLDNARTPDGGYTVSTMYVEAFSEELAETAQREVEEYLFVAHDISFYGEQDFEISGSGDLLDIARQISGVLTVFLTLIASVSLLVGGIGVMNIMLVSVTERTREIGLRKAVGARGMDILSQFLIESVILSLVGGFLGIGVGWAASMLGTNLIPDLTMTVSFDAVLLATGVSTFVGVFFGFYPASRAARMKPIDALRFE